MSVDDGKPWRAPLLNAPPRKRQRPSGSRSQAKTQKRQSEVLEALRKLGNATPRELAAAIGNIDPTTVTSALRALETQGLAYADGQGRVGQNRNAKASNWIWSALPIPYRKRAFDMAIRLDQRATIRRSIPGRKSVQEGKPDKLADLLEEAAKLLRQEVVIGPRSADLLASVLRGEQPTQEAIGKALAEVGDIDDVVPF